MAVSKGKIGKEDVKIWDGKTSTFTRKSSSGRHITLNKMDWCGVDILEVFGGGVNRTHTTLSDAITSIGSTNKVTVYLSPGTWEIDANVTVPANIILDIPSGAVLDVGSGYTLTFSGFQWPTTYQIFSGTGTIAFSVPQTVYPEMWGATGDGSTDDSTEIQYAIDCLETAKGGVVQFLSKTYVCNIEAKSYVELRGSAKRLKGSSTGTTSHSDTYLKASSTGYLVTTASGALYGITIRDISFIGLGSGTALKGLYLQNVSRGVFEDLTFDNFADEAVRINDGNPNYFNRIFAQNCMLDTSQAAKTGVFHLESGADDTYVTNCEFTASIGSLSDANAYICALFVGSANNFFSNIIAEISDIGVHLASGGDQNKFVNVRADLNYSHGFELVSGAGSNVFIGCHSFRNGNETTNTYDGFSIASGATNNSFVGCLAENLGTDSKYHQYGFNDGNNSGTNRNHYSGCKSINHATAWFNANSYLGAGPNIADQNVILATADDTTPTVGQLTFLNVSAATGALSITDFDDATPGQVINVMDSSANGYVTIVHDGVKITTLTGGNIKMKQNRIYTFRSYNGIWHEVGTQQFDTDTTAAGAGTDGTISSRNASALGECDGFAVMYNEAGTAIYVPYWLDITP